MASDQDLVVVFFVLVMVASASCLISVLSLASSRPGVGGGQAFGGYSDLPNLPFEGVPGIKLTAPLETRIEEMRTGILAYGLGKYITKQMTGRDGRIYFVVPNGTENAQLEWLVYLSQVLLRLYMSAVARHGKDDVYTSRLSTLLQDPKVSYVHSQDYEKGQTAFTFLYPSGKEPPQGMYTYPFICMVPWWQAVTMNPRLRPSDVNRRPSVLPFALFLFFHEIGHAISGMFGHNQHWLKAWRWVMLEAEAAGLWSHKTLVDTFSMHNCCRNTPGPGQQYTWDPYRQDDLAKILPSAQKQDQEQQIINIWMNPRYKEGYGCPTGPKKDRCA